MDYTKIEANKVVFLYANVNGASSISLNINNVSFTPDYLVVHSISYDPHNTDSVGTYLLYTDMVGGDIGHFQVVNPGAANIPGPVATPKVFIRLGKTIQGTYNFQFRTVSATPTVVNYALGGYIIIGLEFIKFKAEYPQKVY